MYWESYLTKNLQMTLNYKEPNISEVILAAGYLWLHSDLCEHMYSLHGKQFNWHDSTRTHALHYSTHSTIGGTG